MSDLIKNENGEKKYLVDFYSGEQINEQYWDLEDLPEEPSVLCSRYGAIISMRCERFRGDLEFSFIFSEGVMLYRTVFGNWDNGTWIRR